MKNYDRMRVPFHNIVQHPVSQDHDGEEDGKHLRYKSHGLFLDGCNSLKDTDDKTDRQRNEQHRGCGLDDQKQRLTRDQCDVINCHLLSPFLIRTKSLIECSYKVSDHKVPTVRQNEQKDLKGMDTAVGGNIIIPMAISVDATTISITRNGI